MHLEDVLLPLIRGARTAPYETFNLSSLTRITKSRSRSGRKGLPQAHIKTSPTSLIIMSYDNDNRPAKFIDSDLLPSNAPLGHPRIVRDFDEKTAYWDVGIANTIATLIHLVCPELLPAFMCPGSQYHIIVINSACRLWRLWLSRSGRFMNVMQPPSPPVKLTIVARRAVMLTARRQLVYFKPLKVSAEGNVTRWDATIKLEIDDTGVWVPKSVTNPTSHFMEEELGTSVKTLIYACGLLRSTDKWSDARSRRGSEYGPNGLVGPKGLDDMAAGVGLWLGP
ncbi:hypothetical protein F4778DRAFT_60020 [Xylariomycetidae sp. FL2044]|nr:hypothetical protein F4778DRAFT_60020 [Xylariomycetidae sp. FL2044]